MNEQKNVIVSATISGLVLVEIEGEYKLTLEPEQARELIAGVTWALERLNLKAKSN